MSALLNACSRIGSNRKTKNQKKYSFLSAPQERASQHTETRSLLSYGSLFAKSEEIQAERGGMARWSEALDAHRDGHTRRQQRTVYTWVAIMMMTHR